MKITNLTNSPYSLLDAKGKKVMLPARGVVTIDPHPLHEQQYRALGYFKIENDAPAKAPKAAAKPESKD